MRKIVSLAAAGMIVLAPISAWAQSSEKTPIKIGFIGPLTGVSGEYGKLMLNGLELYLDEIGHKMAGRKVELVVADDKGTPITALEALDKLVKEDKVQTVVGLYFSNVAYALAQKIDNYQVPLLMAIAAADDLTKRQRNRWMLRASRAASQPMHPFGAWVYETLGYKKIATLAVDYAFGWEVVGGFQRSFEEAGGRIVQKVWAPVGGTDYSTYVKALPKDADAVLVVPAGAGTAKIPLQYREAGFRMPLLGMESSFEESLLPTLGPAVEGAVSVTLYSASLDNPNSRKFVKSYRNKYGATPSYYAESCYTSGLWIHKAVNLMHGDIADKEKFLSALKQVQIPDAPRGPITFDEFSNPIQNFYVCKVEKAGDSYRNTVIHTFKNVSQFWKYDPTEFMKQPSYSRDYPPCRYCPAEQK